VDADKVLVARGFVLAALALASGLLAACGLSLLALGVWFVWVGGDAAPGLFSCAMGVLVLYGAYLFGRAVWRTRGRQIDGRAVRGLLLASLVAYGVLLVSPVQPEVRVVALPALILVGIPLALAGEFEPPKRPRRQR
jgi:hypothetical protein